MRYRKLGNGPLVVSELSLGPGSRWPAALNVSRLFAASMLALDNGITLFDTANQYGAGEAERVLGEALRSVPRDRYLIATKLYFPVGDEPDRGFPRRRLRNN